MTCHGTTHPTAHTSHGTSMHAMAPFMHAVAQFSSTAQHIPRHILFHGTTHPTAHTHPTAQACIHGTIDACHGTIVSTAPHHPWHHLMQWLQIRVPWTARAHGKPIVTWHACCPGTHVARHCTTALHATTPATSTGCTVARKYPPTAHCSTTPPSCSCHSRTPSSHTHRTLRQCARA